MEFFTQFSECHDLARYAKQNLKKKSLRESSHFFNAATATSGRSSDYVRVAMDRKLRAGQLFNYGPRLYHQPKLVK